MSASYFDTARTSRALLAQVAGWFGVRQGCAPVDASDNSPIVHLKPPAAATHDIAARLEAEQQRSRQMEQALSQYVSPQVLERLMADPNGLSRGSETRDVTVLFADLQGFTSLAE